MSDAAAAWRDRWEARVSTGSLSHFVLPALAGLLLVAGCGPGEPCQRNLHPEVRRPNPGVVIFVADGLPPRFAEQGCVDGSLPNIKKRFWDGGMHVQRAVASMPCITYSAIATMLTGVGPPRHGMIGNRWFDPTEANFRNYTALSHYYFANPDMEAPTIYEMIKPATSATIQIAHSRGADLTITNWAVSGTMWHFHDYTAVDKLTASSICDVAQWADWERQWPTLLVCYFPGLDTIGHRFGLDSPKFRWALGHTDHQVGRVCDWLERQGLLETTYLVLVSDHGMVNVDPNQHIDLMHVVRDGWGRNATDAMLQRGPDWFRRLFFDRFDTVVNHQDGRRASLHFRAESGWVERPTPEFVAGILEAPPAELQLWNITGVDLVAYLASDDEALLRSQRGTSRILAREGPAGPEYAYVPGPDDVLGYMDDPGLAAFVADGYHGSRDWLQATVEQSRPDVVPSLIPLLRMRRAGQVVLFTKPGYSFKSEHGGHGGIDAGEMLMTFCIAGPGIEPGSTIACARAVDLVPTLLDLLKVKYDREDNPLEGVSLIRAGLMSSKAGSAAP